MQWEPQKTINIKWCLIVFSGGGCGAQINLDSALLVSPLAIDTNC